MYIQYLSFLLLSRAKIYDITYNAIIGIVICQFAAGPGAGASPRRGAAAAEEPHGSDGALVDVGLSCSYLFIFRYFSCASLIVSVSYFFLSMSAFAPLAPKRVPENG